MSKEQKKAFLDLLDKIEEFHKKMDELLLGLSDIEKAFVIGSYVWDLQVKSKKP